MQQNNDFGQAKMNEPLLRRRFFFGCTTAARMLSRSMNR
jgi:hypothetical protein